MAPGAARSKLPSVDPTVYPVRDDVGEDSLQTFIAEVLRPLIARLVAEQGRTAFVGADQFIYWKQYEPTRCIAPDVYVLPGVDPNERIKVWKVWETGIVPSFALEVVSDDESKDVDESPKRYAELGVPEVVVFDPDFQRRRGGVRLRVYRRLAKRGLVLVEATNADRVRSKALGAWIRVVGSGAAVRLRIGLGPRGDELLPTDAERARAEAERACAEAERARAEAERANAERAARLRAEAELARLRASLKRPARRKKT